MFTCVPSRKQYNFCAIYIKNLDRLTNELNEEMTFEDLLKNMRSSHMFVAITYTKANITI